MIFENFEWRIIFRIFLLFAALMLVSFCIVTGQTLYAILCILLVLFTIVSLYQIHVKTHKEIAQFVEAVKYKDFTQHYNEKQGALSVRSLRKGFNEITEAFKVVSREKEIQYQYLQNILQLVDTGILSYDEETREVVWMNDSLKKTLQIPFLKSVNSLATRNQELAHFISELKAGDSRVFTIHLDRNSTRLLISSTAFQTENKRFKLIAFQNINEALDETEAQAWQKLLSVLTHEIMNPIAPISSVADTLKNRLKTMESPAGCGLEDIELGVETIKRRSEGLLKFAETYRNLNKITKPDLSKFYIRDLFENLYQLMLPSFEKKNIELEIILKDPSLIIEADASLLEQVLINLLINAVDAVKEKESPQITLSAQAGPDGKKIIKVSDNGMGMPKEVVEKIFVPFFSTKKTGSGIGLTLCKQIVMLHRGSIQVHSIEGEGTSFVLQL